MQGAGEAAFGEVAGLLGLAYPNNGDQPSIVDTIFARFGNGTTEKHLFSLAISRDQSKDKNGGSITFGGTPNLDDPYINVTSNFFTTVPLEIAKQWNDTALSLFAITVDAFGFGNDNYSEVIADTRQYVVDSGAHFCTLPTAKAAVLNAMFDPPATLNSTGGQYFVDCAAIPPALSFLIGGTPFTINPEDLVVDVGNNACISGVQAARPDSPGFLGDPFLKNVLAVFDIGNSQMQ